MGNKSVLKLWLIVLLIISSLSFLGCNKPKNLTAALNTLSVSMDLNKEYRITEFNIIKDDTTEIKEIFSASDEDILNIRIVNGLSEDKANQYITNQRYLVDNLFSKQKVPYPGPLTNTLECPEEYLPKVEEEKDGDSWRVFYYLYANDRLTFGGCTDDILDYVAVLAFIYCKEKNEVYQLWYFTPKENQTVNYKEIVKSFKCKK